MCKITTEVDTVLNFRTDRSALPNGLHTVVSELSGNVTEIGTRTVKNVYRVGFGEHWLQKRRCPIATAGVAVAVFGSREMLMLAR